MMPSFWDQVTVELVAFHLVVDSCIFLVSWVRVFACSASVLGANVEAMSPAMVHVGAALCGSVARW